MSLEIIALADLLENIDYNEDDVQNILNTFQSIRFTGSEEAHDVAYFTIANKDLYIYRKETCINYQKLCKKELNKEHNLLKKHRFTY